MPRNPPADYSEATLDAILKIHATPCKSYTPMDPATASTNCGKCGRSTTAHVVTSLVRQLRDARRRLTPAP